MKIGFLQLVLLTGALQGIVLSILLFTRKVNIEANRVFAALLLILSFHVIIVAFDKKEFFMQFPHLSHVSWLTPTLLGPLILIFARRITGASSKFNLKEFSYFLPFLVWVGCLTPYFLQSEEYKRKYLSDYEASLKDDFGPLNEISNYLLLLFIGFSILVYQMHRRSIINYYSNISKVKLNWLGQFLYLIFIVLLIAILGFYGRKYQLPLVKEIYPFHFISVVILIYWTGYKALAQPEIFDRTPAPISTPNSIEEGKFAAPSYPEELVSITEREQLATEKKKSSLDEETKLGLANGLEKLMTEEKMYLNSELTIQDLTEKLGTNRQYISEVLNGHFQKNFYDFINDYRIEEFKKQVASPKSQHLTLLSIALESGFNSKATFNAVFKKRTGQTPSEYYKLLKSA